MKNFTLYILFTLFIGEQINAQFTDDFERYNYLKRISPQSLNWITWSEDPIAGTGYIEDEDGIVSNTDYSNYGEVQHFAHSGKQAMFIGKSNLGSQPQDVVLDLHNKSTGKWNLTWKMFIPKKNNRAYYNFQENTPIIGSGNWAIQVYFNGNGNGEIMNDNGGVIVSFTYPWKEWFEIVHTIDLDNDTIKIELVSSSGTVEIYNANFLSNTQHLGGVDFYSVDKKNKFYIDDVVFEKTIPIEDVYIWDNNRWESESGNPLSGEPDTSYEVIIREPFTVGVSTATNTLSCLNLVFESGGTLTIPTQTNAVISGDLTVPSSNKIIVEDGGSFVMLNNTATFSMPNTNSFEYTRTSEVMANVTDFTYWSSPVEGIDVSNFGSSVVYTFDTANFIDLYSGVGYPQTTGSPDGFDDNGDDWSIANNTDIIISGKGYAVLNQGITSQQTITFAGKPNNGYISIPVALSGDDSNADDDWNIIGNPYASAIDASILINSNINISGTLYFWTHNTKVGDGSNIGPDGSNYNANDYASFNLSGGVAASTGGEIPNGFIASGQGFFMEVDNNGMVTFNNDMRVTNTVNENTQFFKSTNDKEDNIVNEKLVYKNRIWLSFSNNEGAFSQSLIAFLPGASDEYESTYDGVRAGIDLNSKFYSILGDKELAIQGRTVFTNDVEIPLGFYITKPEEFTISIDRLEGELITEESTNIYLIDYELNKTHNLKFADYYFNVLESGTNNTRFALQFTNSNFGINDITNVEELIITNADNSFKINANKVVKAINVYDMMGRLLINIVPNKQSFYLNTSKIKKGTIVIVQASFENDTVISKKMIKF